MDVHTKKLLKSIFIALSIVIMLGATVLSAMAQLSYQIDPLPSWTPVKATGNESTLTFWKESDDKKISIGWIPLNNSCANMTDKYIFGRDGTTILDDKAKPILVKCETAKCGTANCYHITLTDAAAVNVDDFIKLGNQSFVTIYQNESKTKFVSDYNWNITTILYKNISGNFVISPDKIWLKQISNESIKFGANDTYGAAGTRYQYFFNSTKEILGTNGSYKIYKYSNTTWDLFGGFKTTSYYSNIDLSDICSKGNCTYQENKRNITYGNMTRLELRELRVYFTGQFNSTTNITIIDPTISESYTSSSTFGIFNNTLATPSGIVLSSVASNGTFSRVIDAWNGSTDFNLSQEIYWHNMSWNYLAKDAVLYWSLNENNAVQKDLSGYNKTGFVTGATFISNGKYGGAYGFSGGGSGDYMQTSVDIPQINSGAQDKSVCFWVNTTTSTSGILVNYLKDSYQLLNPPYNWYIILNGFAHFTVGGFADQNERDTGLIVNDGIWHHMCVMKNSTLLWVYKDGIMSYNSTHDNNAIDQDSTSKVYVAASFNVGHYCEGQFDEIYIFNRSLSNSEVNLLMNNTRPKDANVSVQMRVRYANAASEVYDTTKLISWLKFNSNTTNIYDYSGNNRNGTIAGTYVWKNGTDCYPSGDGCFETKDNTADSYINFTNSGAIKTLNRNFSINTWVKINQAPSVSYPTIFSTGLSGLNIFLTAGTRNLGISHSGIAILTNNCPALVYGQWYMITAQVQASGELNLYENGVICSNATTAEVFSDSSNEPTINMDSTTQTMNATYDSFEIYNRTLSTEEISYNYMHTKPSDFSAWSTYYTNQNLSILDGVLNARFIQYEGLFSSLNGIDNPLLTSVSAVYDDIISDSTPPNQTSYVSFSITNSTAKINTTTDENANASLKYGSSLSLSSTANNLTLGTNHGFTLTGLTNQTLYYYNVSYCDAYGNCANYGTYNFTTIEQSPPVLNVQSPVNNSLYSVTNLSLNYTVSDNTAVDKCWFVNSTGQTKTLTSCLNTTFIGKEGVQNITVYANDTYNYISSKQIFFTIDTTNPVVAIQSPVNQTYTTTNLSINYTVVDSNKDKCWYSLNGNGNINIASCLNTTFLGNQSWNNLTLFSNDTSNHISNSTIQFFIDSIPPASISNLRQTDSTASSITFNWTNPATDYNHTELFLYETSDLSTILKTRNTTDDFSVVIGLAISTNYTEMARACDNVGLCSALVNTTGMTSSGGGGLTFTEALQLARADAQSADANITIYNVKNCLDTGYWINGSSCIIATQNNITMLYNMLMTRSNLTIEQIINLNLSTQSNISQILADTTSINSRIKDNVFAHLSLPSGHIYINATPVFAVWLTNNSAYNSLTDFQIIIYNQSGIEETRKDQSFFNNEQNIYWQTFTFTRAGEYKANFNVTYNGLSKIISQPFTISSTAAQYDVTVNCPATANVGDTITCQIGFKRIFDENGDAIYTYGFTDEAPYSQTTYTYANQWTYVNLTANILTAGTRTFQVIMTNADPQATASDVINIGTSTTTATASAGGYSQPQPKEFVLVAKKYLAPQYLFYFLVFIVAAIITIVVVKRRKENGTTHSM